MCKHPGRGEGMVRGARAGPPVSTLDFDRSAATELDPPPSPAPVDFISITPRDRANKQDSLSPAHHKVVLGTPGVQPLWPNWDTLVIFLYDSVPIYCVAHHIKSYSNIF